MPTIRIDDEVYEWLRRHAEPFVDTPNSVLRRTLGIGAQTSPAERAKTGGQLLPLVEAGLLASGDDLEWRRRDATHRASVTADGRLRLETGEVVDSPSAAAKALSGYEVNGWRAWGRARDRIRLSTLRDRL
jgi:hypothetical protein